MRRTLLLVVVSVAVTFSAPSRAQFCPGVSPWVFDDVQASDQFCGYITWMAQNGISLGCQVIDANHRLYCPSANVSRSQMAAFMSRLGNGAVFKQGGNAFGATAQLGTTDDNAVEIVAKGSRVMRLEPNAISPNVIGGSPANFVTAGVRGATIAGGGAPPGDSDPDFAQEAPNRVTDVYGTVVGGFANLAGNNSGPVNDAYFATVGGGAVNTASGILSTVAGGYQNIASGDSSTVAGGLDNAATGARGTIGGGSGNAASGAFSSVAGGSSNTASGSLSSVAGGSTNSATGYSSTVPGGYSNIASGDYSLAAGARAKATHERSFVWGGSIVVDTNSIAAGDFVVYAPTAVRMLAGPPGAGGCTLTSGASGWSCSSDRALKSDVAPVDTMSMLERVVAMPVSRWSFTSVPGVTHVGPMAQDFHAAFGLGDDDTRIAPMDAQGVALAAIQGLNAKLEREIAARDAKIAELMAAHAIEIAELKRAIDVLLARTSPEGRMAAK
ncbi:MAG: tail fiber domain-containing protein [Burkholderiales bacterium]